MSLCLSFATLLSIARAHTVIVYPGMRGNSLHTNGTVVQSQGLGSYTTDNGTIWPYGMQWDFPCKPASPEDLAIRIYIDFLFRWRHAHLTKPNEVAC